MDDEILAKLAKEAGASIFVTKDGSSVGLTTFEKLKAFASLVVQHERNRTWTQRDWTEYEHSIAAAEREACAKVCDAIDKSHWGCEVKASWCSDAIRARGQA